MVKPRVEFWFEFASTYSYLAASRIEQLATQHGVEVQWRPFLLGPIFAAQGWATSPFNIFEAKGRNMWRDMERLSAPLGLKLVRPSAFPRNGLLPARVAVLGAQEAWGPEFTRAVYHANFAEDRDIADAAVIAALLHDLRLPADDILQRAQSAENKEALKRQTMRAIELGLFGAPSFTVGKELFWGNDRLEQALAWAEKHPS
ncbi:MAG: 2-hydroxychromene-2-carboxylate isomerase [Rhodospirillales bacterium]